MVGGASEGVMTEADWLDVFDQHKKKDKLKKQQKCHYPNSDGSAVPEELQSLYNGVRRELIAVLGKDRQEVGFPAKNPLRKMFYSSLVEEYKTLPNLPNQKKGETLGYRDKLLLSVLYDEIYHPKADGLSGVLVKEMLRQRDSVFKDIKTNYAEIFFELITSIDREEAQRIIKGYAPDIPGLFRKAVSLKNYELAETILSSTQDTNVMLRDIPKEDKDILFQTALDAGDYKVAVAISDSHATRNLGFHAQYKTTLIGKVQDSRHLAGIFLERCSQTGDDKRAGEIFQSLSPEGKKNLLSQRVLY